VNRYLMATIGIKAKFIFTSNMQQYAL